MAKSISYANNIFFKIIFVLFLLTIFETIFLLSNFAFNNNHKLSFLDAIFTATSSICSTGILPFEIDKFSFFGKIIFLFFVQIGGIGTTVIILIFFSLFEKTGIEFYFLTSKFFETSYILNNLKKLIKIIFITTVMSELVGAFLYKIVAYFYSINLSFLDTLSISINNFCNSGFISNKQLIIINNNPYLLIISSLLALIGSLGFLFFFEISNFFKKNKNELQIKNEKKIFSITTKISTKIYFYSLIIGFLFYIFFFKENISILSISKSLFTAISLKSLGIFLYTKVFNTWLALFILFYGFTGTFAFSTGSGLRSTFLGIILFSTKSLLTGATYPIINKRTISWNIITKVYAIFIYIILFSFLIAIFIENYINNEKIKFLSIFSDILSVVLGNGFLWNSFYYEHSLLKIILIISIFFGKISFILFGLPISKKETVINYPEDDIIIF